VPPHAHQQQHGSCRHSGNRQLTCNAGHKSVQGTNAGPSNSDVNRRGVLSGLGVVLLLGVAQPQASKAAEMDTVEETAFNAYSEQDFKTASEALTELLSQDSQNPRWYEMRAQVLVDGKNFEGALSDFEDALKLTPPEALTDRARLVAGRALAYEGVSKWQLALDDYTEAVRLAAEGGEKLDPYVVNSIGNCYNSLGLWPEAREKYLLSSELFQQAKGFRGRNGSTTQRLDGAIYSASNGALMLAQMGDEAGALKEAERIARRAPNSVDMRAALAALYWAQGKPEAAESSWEYACNGIMTGCSKYEDPDWLVRVRRWPPLMAERLSQFLQLERNAAVSKKQSVV